MDLPDRRIYRKPEERQSKSNIGKTTEASRLNKDRVVFGLPGRPSKAQLALIERYKADTNKSLVESNIEDIVSEKILEIREVIQNMIDYGDYSIFKVLPKELDDKIQSYGLFAQEYFGKKIKDLDGIEVFIVPVSFKRCNKCGKYKRPDEYYLSYSEVSDGIIPVCKDCAKRIFSDYFKKYRDIKECLILISQKLDVIVYEPVLTKFIQYASTEDGKKEILKGTFLGNYLLEVWMSCNNTGIPEDKRGFSDSNFSGVPFKCVNKIVMPPIYDDKFSENDEENEDGDSPQSVSRIKKLKLKWGNLPPEDLIELDKTYNEWYEKCDIDGLSREKLVMQLCYEELDINRTRASGGVVKDKIKSFRELMKDSDLTPRKQTVSSSDSQFSSLGDFIRHAELYKPIINKNPVFEDVDGIKKLWRSITGAIFRTLGKDNEYVREFEKNYERYTSNIMKTTDVDDEQDNDDEEIIDQSELNGELKDDDTESTK